MTFALSGTVLIALVGGGIDYARLVSRRSQLQAAVDAGVIAGGNALKLAATSTEVVKGVTEQTIRDAAKPAPDRPFVLTIEVPSGRSRVFARAEETVRLAFGGLFGIAARTVAAHAQVSVVGRMRLCMLTLDPAAPGTFLLKQAAQVTAVNCSLYSNSDNPAGMIGEASSKAQAEKVCSRGGFRGPRANFAPVPQTGCPTIEDPLKDRYIPNTEGECTYLPYPFGRTANGRLRKYNVIEGRSRVDLEPGVYCNGLLIDDYAVVNLKPGIYIFRNGPLYVNGRATLSGVNVGLYFNGPEGGLLFNEHTTISLTAPTTGAMAGLLLSEDRFLTRSVDPATGMAIPTGSEGGGASPTPPPMGASQPMRTYRIISNNARTMLGTIYLPAGRLVIDSERPVADQSAYTVVVAQQVNLYKGPNLVLNADYDRTNVPVPDGVGPLFGKLRLTK